MGNSNTKMVQEEVDEEETELECLIRSVQELKKEFNALRTKLDRDLMTIKKRIEKDQENIAMRKRGRGREEEEEDEIRKRVRIEEDERDKVRREIIRKRT